VQRAMEEERDVFLTRWTRARPLLLRPTPNTHTCANKARARLVVPPRVPSEEVKKTHPTI